MMDLAAHRDTIQAVSDEINSVTYAPDLAAGTRRLLDQSPPSGIYHLTNSGGVSWYDFAQEIFRIARKQVDRPPGPLHALPPQGAAPRQSDPAQHQARPDETLAGGPG